MQAKQRRKVIKALAKGQVTIPSKFRDALGIDAETLLSITLVEGHLEVTPLRQGEDALQCYTEENKLDDETVRQVRELVGRGEL